MCSCSGDVVRGLISVIWSTVFLILVVGVDVCTAFMIYSFEVCIEV